jgi:hypothetical protein
MNQQIDALQGAKFLQYADYGELSFKPDAIQAAMGHYGEDEELAWWLKQGASWFAAEADGGLVGLLNVEGIDPEARPVVYLSNEGNVALTGFNFVDHLARQPAGWPTELLSACKRLGLPGPRSSAEIEKLAVEVGLRDQFLSRKNVGAVDINRLAAIAAERRPLPSKPKLPKEKVGKPGFPSGGVYGFTSSGNVQVVSASFKDVRTYRWDGEQLILEGISAAARLAGMLRGERFFIRDTNLEIVREAGVVTVNIPGAAYAPVRTSPTELLVEDAEGPLRYADGAFVPVHRSAKEPLFFRGFLDTDAVFDDLDGGKLVRVARDGSRRDLDFACDLEVLGIGRWLYGCTNDTHVISEGAVQSFEGGRPTDAWKLPAKAKHVTWKAITAGGTWIGLYAGGTWAVFDRSTNEFRFVQGGLSRGPTNNDGVAIPLDDRFVLLAGGSSGGEDAIPELMDLTAMTIRPLPGTEDVHRLQIARA